MTAGKYAALTGRKPHKYRVKATDLDGIRFASRAEAERYGELKLLMRAGVITDLLLQPRFPLVVNGIAVASYTSGFLHTDCTNGRQVVEDTKGMAAPVYRIKKKLVEGLYGITVVEVRG